MATKKSNNIIDLTNTFNEIKNQIKICEEKLELLPIVVISVEKKGDIKVFSGKKITNPDELERNQIWLQHEIYLLNQKKSKLIKKHPALRSKENEDNPFVS